MELFSLIILLVIGYYCFKAVRNIWHDTFGNVGIDEKDNKRRWGFTDNQQSTHGNGTSGSNYDAHRNDNHYGHSHNNYNNGRPDGDNSPRVRQDEGEYVDFDES